MKPSTILPVLFVLALQVPAAPADDCSKTHPDDVVSVSWQRSPDRSRSLEVHANGLVRYLRDGSPEHELWLESWIVGDILESLHHLVTTREPKADASSEERYDIPFSLACSGSPEDREVQLVVSRPSDLWSEIDAVNFWLRNQRAPMWMSRPWPLEICEPQYRRSLRLEVAEPVWCDGWFGPNRLDDPEARWRLSEALEAAVHAGAGRDPAPEVP